MPDAPALQIEPQPYIYRQAVRASAMQALQVSPDAPKSRTQCWFIRRCDRLICLVLFSHPTNFTLKSRRSRSDKQSNVPGQPGSWSGWRAESTQLQGAPIVAMTINTNVVSLNAQRNLSNSKMTLATAMERLSSGLRINSARDDAAGLLHDLGT